MRVRLLKKLALFLDGIDLTSRVVGEIFDCSEESARLLVLEGWAEFVDPMAELFWDDHPDLVLFEKPSLPFWFVIDSHRDGKKDKLAPQGDEANSSVE